MRAPLRPGQLFNRALSAVLGLLLAVQVAFSFFPVDLPLAEGSVRVVVCGPEGLQTVTIDLASGKIDTSSGTGDSKCPFCVVGVADLVLAFVPPPRDMTVHRVPYERLAAQELIRQPYDRAAPIRAPPAVL